MRLALDLRRVDDAAECLRLAQEVDRFGIWAVVLAGHGGIGGVRAAEVAVATSNVHLALMVDLAEVHPFAAAEELAVLDHLSERRMLAIARGEPDQVAHLRDLLAGHIVDGVAVAPPPAQTALPVWSESDLDAVALSGDLAADRPTIDDRRDAGVTHLAVEWPGDLLVLARHLAARASSPSFPDLVADMADRLPTHDD